jgi:hypothetical protein
VISVGNTINKARRDDQKHTESNDLLNKYCTEINKLCYLYFHNSPINTDIKDDILYLRTKEVNGHKVSPLDSKFTADDYWANKYLLDYWLIESETILKRLRENKLKNLRIDMKDENTQKNIIQQPSTSPLKGLRFSAMMFLISAIGAGTGAFTTSFLTEKARLSAIESSLEVIQKQTKMTEEVKTNLDYDNWKNKDLDVTKRQKLEEYYSALSSFQNKLIFNLKDETDYLKELERADLIQSFYLGELDQEQFKIMGAAIQYMDWVAVNYGLKPNESDEAHIKKGNELKEILSIFIVKSKVKTADIAQKLNTKKADS